MEYYLGVILGAFLAAIFGAALIIAMKKFTKTDSSIKCKYDERQQIVRGIGFKYGFFSLIFYNVAAAFYISIEKKPYIDHATLMLTGIFLGIFIYAVYCIWNEGYFSINENPKRVVISFALIALLNFGVGYRSFLHGTLIEDGMFSISCLNIFCGILSLMLLSVMVIKHIWNGKEEK